MMETTKAPFPIGISPADLFVGQEVDVESRTWAGINKPGGHATIIKVHHDEYSSVPTGVDVKYVLGGRDFAVELTYVKAHVDLNRGSRGRRRDVKMNVGTFGGEQKTTGRSRRGGGGNKKKAENANRGGKKKKALLSSPTKSKKGGSAVKKRKALANIDGNDGSKGAKVARKSIAKVVVEKEEEPSKNDVAAANAVTKSKKAATAEGSTMKDVVETTKEEDGSWTLIQDGNIADYTTTLREGTRISYWWSDEDGWLPGIISKSLSKVVTSTTVRWTVKVGFDNGDDHMLAFHPLEKRWKVFRSNGEEAKTVRESKLNESPKKLAAVEKSASQQSTKPVGGKKVVRRKASKKTTEGKDKKTKAASENSITAQSSSAYKSHITTQAKGEDKQQTKQKRQSTLSFGTDLQSKIREISSKMHNTASAAKSPSSSSIADKLANIGYGPSLPRGTLPPDEKKTLPQDAEEIAKKKATQVSLFRPSSLEARKNSQVAACGKKLAASAENTEKVVNKSQGSTGYAESLKKAPSEKKGSQKSVMQSLYKSECDKADKFVDFMTGSSARVKSQEKSVPAASAVSPDTDEDDLELKLDQG